MLDACLWWRKFAFPLFLFFKRSLRLSGSEPTYIVAEDRISDLSECSFTLIQTDRQTDGHSGGQTDRQTVSPTIWKLNIQAEQSGFQTDGQNDRQEDRKSERQPHILNCGSSPTTNQKTEPHQQHPHNHICHPVCTVDTQELLKAAQRVSVALPRLVTHHSERRVSGGRRDDVHRFVLLPVVSFLPAYYHLHSPPTLTRCKYIWGKKASRIVSTVRQPGRWLRATDRWIDGYRDKTRFHICDLQGHVADRHECLYRIVYPVQQLWTASI